MFNSEDQCLFQLPEFVVWCRDVWEERTQTLLCDAMDLRQVEPRRRREYESGGDLIKRSELPRRESMSVLLEGVWITRPTWWSREDQGEWRIGLRGRSNCRGACKNRLPSSAAFPIPKVQRESPRSQTPDLRL